MCGGRAGKFGVALARGIRIPSSKTTGIQKGKWGLMGTRHASTPCTQQKAMAEASPSRGAPEVRTLGDLDLGRDD